MADILNTSVTIKDALTGESIGGRVPPKFIRTSKETLTGEGYGSGPIKSALVFKDALTGVDLGGKNLPGFANSIKEVLTGNGYGTGPIKTSLSTKEALTSNQVGQQIDLLFLVASTVVETLGKSPPVDVMKVHKDVLLDAPNDATTIAWEVRNERALIAQRNSSRPNPATVRSLTSVSTARELVAQKRVTFKPRSVSTVYTVRQMIAIDRPMLPPSGSFSEIRNSVVREMVLLSRAIKYLPPEGAFVFTSRQLVAQSVPVVTPPVDRWSNLTTATVRELVLQSLRSGSYDVSAQTVMQMVLRRREITFSQPTHVLTDVQLVTQHRVPSPIWTSPAIVGSAPQLVTQSRDAREIHSDTQVPSEIQQVVQQRDVGEIRSTTSTYTEQQLVVQHRVPSPLPPTPMYVQTERALVVQQSVRAVPISDSYVQTQRQLVMQRRETAPPNATSDWQVKVNRQLIVQNRSTGGVVRSEIMVKTERVMYTLHADYLPPDEVIGPEVGAQVKQQFVLAVQHRVTEEPGDVSMRSRFVFNVAQRPVITDDFPDPALPASDLDVFSAGEVVVIGDDLGNPYAGYSDVDAFSVGQGVVLGDQFDDPRTPLSDVSAFFLYQTPISSDTDLPDPTLPASDLTLISLAGFAALGDTEFPDPVIPVSEVQAGLVASFAAIGDAFGNPLDPHSELSVLSVAGVLLMVDKSLYGLPARTNRRRPVISVSMS